MWLIAALLALLLWWQWGRDRRALAGARRLLGLGQNADRDGIEAAFRSRLRSAHPDAGGTNQDTRELTMARALLLAEIDRRDRQA